MPVKFLEAAYRLGETQMIDHENDMGMGLIEFIFLWGGLRTHGNGSKQRRKRKS